ncbi:MAG: GNAT family N-acetyltransferase [Ruminiclostridium sp.]|nr:GNAT family N-acetyltransferase [Ruminiclostridium sp.]
MIVRKACAEDIRAAYQCIEDAREYHRSMGFVQWHPGYPTCATIEQDVEAGIGYVFAEGHEICGYCCMIFGDEPAYHRIDGAWKTDRPYAVIHRMAFSQQSRGKGLSGEALALVKAYCLEHGVEAIRVDTQGENVVMQHILDREGFAYCGLVHFDGGPKLAYEWDG